MTAVRNNGTVRARKGRVTDTFNIQNLTPFKEKAPWVRMTYTAVGLAKYGQQLAKLIACDDHLR